jgi:hypothetical protein
VTRRAAAPAPTDVRVEQPWDRRRLQTLEMRMESCQLSRWPRRAAGTRKRRRIRRCGWCARSVRRPASAMAQLPHLLLQPTDLGVVLRGHAGGVETVRKWVNQADVDAGERARPELKGSVGDEGCGLAGPMTLRLGTPTLPGGTSRRAHRTSCGSPTSPTWRRGPVSPTCASSSTPSPG